MPESRNAIDIVGEAQGDIATGCKSVLRMRITRTYSGSLTSIAQVIGRFGGGGAQRLALNLAVALKHRGENCLAVAVRRTDAKGAAFDFETDGVECIGLDIEPNSMWSLLGGARRLRALVRERGIRVLHVHGADCLPFCDLALTGLRGRPRLVFTWHDSKRVLHQRGIRRRLMLRALRRCANVYGSSRHVATRVGTALGNGHKVEVFGNGVPTIDHPPQLLDRSLTFVWAGRMVPDKAPNLLLQACERLLAMDVHFKVRMIGDAPPGREQYAQQIRKTAYATNLNDIVTFDGWINDVPAVLEDAQIGVQTSRSEGLSMALLEQMMAGLAIVATDVGDTAEALDHGRCGLLIDPGDVDGLTAALERLITEPDLRQRLGRAARERALEHYSLNAMAKRAIAVYRHCLGPCTGGHER